MATLWYAENYVKLIKRAIAKGPYESRWFEERLNRIVQRADEQVKGIKKMMVYRNLLIHATMAYEKKITSYIDYINEVMVLKDHADLLDSGWIMLPENETFDVNLALQEEREKSGKSLSFPRAFEAYHTKAEADRIAKDVHYG